MILLVTSFLAGMFSVLAPCVAIFIPVLFARTATNKRSPLVMLVSLGLSIVFFSIILKSTTLFIEVPASFWSVVSGVIVIIFGIVTLWPKVWESVSLKFNLLLGAQKSLDAASKRDGFWGDVLVGASLGPVFSACSPTYALIIATILPAEPLAGLVYILAYVAGLLFLLSLIALFGRRLLSKLRWGLNPGSAFHKVLGIVLIVLGLAIATGFDKFLLGWFVSAGLFDWQITIENSLL